MYKLDSLQKLLEASLPKQVKANPENLIIQATDGNLDAALGDNLSFAYNYNVEITVCNWPAAVHVDALFVPLLAWVNVHQSDLLANTDKRKNAIKFWVHPVTTDSYDLGIDIPLRERVVVKEDPKHKTRFNAEHMRETCHVAVPCMAEHWELWLKDKKLGEWDIPMPGRISRFEV